VLLVVSWLYSEKAPQVPTCERLAHTDLRHEYLHGDCAASNGDLSSDKGLLYCYYVAASCSAKVRAWPPEGKFTCRRR
jgi:hypothetical protein